jgi:hypothetical protein
MPINEAAGRSIDPEPDDDDPCHGPEDTTCPSCGLGFVQSDTEPVAWQYRWRVKADADWTEWREINEIGANHYAGLPDHEVRPLYTARLALTRNRRNDTPR